MRIMITTLLLLTGILYANKIDLKQFNALDIIKENQMTVVDAMELDGLYFLKVERADSTINFYLSKNKQYLIQGNGIKLADRSKVEFPIDPKEVIGKENFSFGTGKEVLYVFTDPECPYCAKFDNKMQTLGKRYTFKIFMFPLAFHKNAVKMSEFILSAPSDKEKAKRLNDISNRSAEYTRAKVSKADRDKVAKILAKNRKIAKSIGVNGTPTVLDSKMQRVSWPTLKP